MTVCVRVRFLMQNNLVPLREDSYVVSSSFLLYGCPFSPWNCFRTEKLYLLSRVRSYPDRRQARRTRLEGSALDRSVRGHRGRRHAEAAVPHAGQDALG